MKKLFSIILSFSLVVLPVSTARATTPQYAQQILGMANGIMGSSILIKCSLGATQPSLLVYMAGGVVYIVSELTTGKKKTQDLETNAKKLDELKATMKEGGDYQKASVEMQLADAKSNLDYLQKRRKWLLALKAIYATATGLAALEMILKAPPIFKPDIGACTSKPEADMAATTLIASAYGAVSTSGSLGGMAVGMAAGYAVQKLLPNLIDGTKIADKSVGLLNTSQGRMAFFGFTTLLTGLIEKDLKEQESEIKSRIETIEKLKKQFDQADNSIAEGASTPTPGTAAMPGSATADPSKTYGLAALPKGSEAVAQNCLSQGTDGKVSYSIEACTNPVKIPRTMFTPNFQIPTLQSGATTTADLAQALASGNGAKADVEAAKLAAMAGNLEKVKDDLIKKVNDQLKAEGKAPIDVSGELNRQVASMSNALGGGNSSGTNSSGQVASAAGTAKVSETKKEIVNPSSVDGADKINGSQVAPATAIDLSSIEAGASGSENVDDGMNNGKDASANTKLASLEDSLGQYEDNQSDIAKDEGVSIFKQVSNRYLLNYDKIFKKKGITPPLASP